jgi:hypothetical protein
MLKHLNGMILDLLFIFLNILLKIDTPRQFICLFYSNRSKFSFGTAKILTSLNINMDHKESKLDFLFKF